MKTLTFYRPKTIHNIMNEFDNCLETLDSLLPPATRMFNHIPVVDVREIDGAYLLEMELPGYDEKNIEVSVHGSNLTIASRQEAETEKEEKTDENQGVFLIKERRYSSFSRSFKLPQGANLEAVNASFKNGILSLEIKKRAEAKKRAILINAA
ncbi:MAG: Hsp20/alpha crystallin family protein [Treponema sp.]|nr:Hsp20/alpha crystallin family protein [Treponema sp.]